MELDDAWDNFNDNDYHDSEYKVITNVPSTIPTCGKLLISTKTKILYLNKELDLYNLFWNIPMISYDDQKEGVIKKQSKFNFNSKEEVDDFDNKIKKIDKPVKTIILNQVENSNGRVKFKDIRKVTIGYSKNDIIKYNKKNKSAFYNCLVIIYRVYYENKFKEFHLKLFNSGKIEIPGIQNDKFIDICSDTLKHILNPFYENIEEIYEKRETVLVNSNFNCNYYLKRDELYNIMKYKYNIKCNYDSCNYPGIQCKYILKDKKEISFMIFRTGSILIVGKCENDELYEVYKYIIKLLNDNFTDIYQQDTVQKMIKVKKKHTRFIYIA